VAQGEGPEFKPQYRKKKKNYIKVDARTKKNTTSDKAFIS
jgi:hypothetical protein